MACQWNTNPTPAAGGGTVSGGGMMQNGGMQNGTMTQHMGSPSMQTSGCSQMTNIRTRSAQNQTVGRAAAQAPVTNGVPLPQNSAVETPSTVQSPYYTAGFLRNFIGCNMRVEFLIGTTGALVDRIGVLMEVGASYIVLQPFMTDDLLMCDLYSIKFVTIYG